MGKFLRMLYRGGSVWNKLWWTRFCGADNGERMFEIKVIR